MDILKMNLEQLKSLGYDQILELQRVQNNINLIQARISELEKEQNGTEDKKDTTK